MWRHVFRRPAVVRCLIQRPFSDQSIGPCPTAREEKQVTFCETVKKSAADRFGNLTEFHPNIPYDPSALPAEVTEDLDDHDGEVEYFEKISNPNRRLPIEWFNDIFDLLQPPNMDLKAALDLFDVKMKEDLIKPIPQMHRLLIHACGVRGYFEKAFELHKDYKAREYPHNHGLYCDLFNSCANFPKGNEFLRFEALRRAQGLREALVTEVVAVPIPVYNTMIKALSRCGDPEAGLGILDEIVQKFRSIDSSTANHALQVCVGDKEAGFRHGLMLWRKLRLFRTKLDVYSYNLMLRLVKECGAGNPKHLQEVLVESMTSKDARKTKRKQLPWYKTRTMLDKTTEGGVALLNPEEERKLREVLEQAEPDVLPNLLEPEPNFSQGRIVGFSGEALDLPQNRLQLLGNVEGFLRCMVEVDGQKPDVKTFSQLLHCVQPGQESEEAVTKAMKTFGVAPDVGFFNQLIVMKTKRRDYDGGRAVLDQIVAHDLSPDLTTFHYLAGCCRNNRDTMLFLADLKRTGVRPNVRIMTSLIGNAMVRYDPGMVQRLLKITTHQQGIRLDILLLKKVGAFFQRYRKIVVAIERGESEELRGKMSNFHLDRIAENVRENRMESWREFVRFYREMMSEAELDIPQHPWKQYLTERDMHKLEKYSSKVIKHVVDFDPEKSSSEVK